ncbi:hypothetical protein ACFO6R_00815 [Eubacterium multiforme]|uniref:Uncharacterized protein n=1 Tax=Eubacterium multiforme TaxID=83339 RepID=A0ABT9UPY9_9FIRM|nr:hypothetical protein [Eubacterium multiforme]MDQ0148718.1 hypothetical protein [Eubacterium multiforme]
MEILKKLNFKRRLSIKKYEEIINFKTILDARSKDFSNLLDNLSILTGDMEWLKDTSLELHNKIKLAIEKNNIPLAKKALNKKFSFDLEIHSLEKRLHHLNDCKLKIQNLLKNLEDEYDNIIISYENKLTNQTLFYMKSFSKIEKDLRKELLITEEIFTNRDYENKVIDINEELKKYLN